MHCKDAPVSAVPPSDLRHADVTAAAAAASHTKAFGIWEKCSRARSHALK